MSIVTRGLGYESPNLETAGTVIDVGLIENNQVAVSTSVDDISISIAIDESDEVTVEVT